MRRLDTLGFCKRFLVAKCGPVVTSLTRGNIFEDVRLLCLFVGHGRSGSSLVGALLNAHPNIIMTNELHALRYLDRGVSEHELFNLIYYIDKRLVQRGSIGGGGYDYAVPRQWQGKHSKLYVLGDRKAGATAAEILKNPRILQRIRDSLSVDIRFIHVVRNPYDSISTTFRKTTRRPNETPGGHLEREIQGYFERCTAVQVLREEFGNDSVELVFHERLVEDPYFTLTELCRFLNVSAPENYISDCASIIKRKPHKTRNSIEWSRKQVEIVAGEMRRFPWLEGYSFDMSD